MKEISKIKEAREKEKSVGITTLGWLFIILSFVFTFAMSRQALTFYKYLNDMSMGVRVLLPKLTIPILIGFSYLLLTGIGILRLKRWAYYSVFIVIFTYCMSIMKLIIIIGFQFLNKYLTLALLFSSIAAIIFLLNKDVIKQFGADFINKKNRRIYPQRVLRQLLCVFAVMSIFSISISFFVAKDSFLNIVTQKIKYQTDKAYILNECKKINIFDYSIYIPNDFMIISASMGDSNLGWALFLSERSGGSVKTRSFIVLESESRFILPLSKMLGFKTAYDFEKAINSPLFITPVALLVLRGVSILNDADLVGIDNAAGHAWKGFVRVANIKDKEKLFYDASLYSLQNDKVCKIVISARESMLPEQVKSVIASVEFNDSNQDAASVFKEGKLALSDDDFVSAGINFMNALYLDGQNPEYAYYLSRALFEDINKDGRKSRLSSAGEFLRYAIKLNPEHYEAKELLLLVDDEIKQAKENG